ncbi:MAG: CRISPR-associated protein Csm6 [Lachnospiraceae bacterium]|nr:CRISPR-associated protein Csm6 [Lachnospiraceae bacterium]
MEKKILFSPVGGTDPIKYLRDGSMLHICRHYQPDLVYLYLSHEMMEYHRQDNRYVDALERLGRQIGHTFEIHLIERDDLIDVQQYDIFYKDFRQEIQKIEQEMDNSDILLLNMASGTPAMKSALLVMATFAEYRFLPIQVSTPQKKMNKVYEDRDSFENDLEFALNEDNAQDAPNRCEEVKCLNLMKLIKMDAIKKHVLAYDYPAALSVAKEIKEDLCEDAFRLLQIADARIKLDHDKMNKLMAGKKYHIYPVKEGNNRKVFEYALALQIKVIKQDYADFIRGITPLTVDLLEYILKSRCGILLNDCCKKDQKGVMKWHEGKLKRAGLFDLLQEEYNGGFKLGPVYANHLEKLIARKCGDDRLCQKVKAITQIESQVRNVAAHEIVSVTDQWIREKTEGTACSALDILKIIKQIVEFAGLAAEKSQAWNSYDCMNEKITEYLG